MPARPHDSVVENSSTDNVSRQENTPLEKNVNTEVHSEIDEAQPQEEAKPSRLGIPQRRFTSISISDVQQNKPLVSLENREMETLTQQRLEDLWNELLVKYQDDEKFCALLADKKVELKSQNLFTIQVPNLFFDSQFRDYQGRILGFLREMTGNEALQFKVVVVVEQVEKRAYMPREKFDELLKVNPAILSLRKLFPDIDF